MTTAGSVTLFPVSSYSSNTAGMYSLAAGADGNLWFTEEYFNKGFVLGRMSPSGVVTRVPIHNLSRAIVEVANGPNRSLIVTAQNDKGQTEAVLRMSADGAITPYKVPAANSNAFSTDLGSADGSLWFTTDDLGLDMAGSPRAAWLRPMTCPTSSAADSVRSSRWPSDRIGKLYLLVQGNLNAMVYRLSPS